MKELRQIIKHLKNIERLLKGIAFMLYTISIFNVAFLTTLYGGKDVAILVAFILTIIALYILTVKEEEEDWLEEEEDD